MGQLETSDSPHMKSVIRLTAEVSQLERPTESVLSRMNSFGMRNANP
jgi:hypothetical protein